MRKIRITTATAVACAAALFVAPLQAEGDDFYKGKTVQLVVGYSPGGGYDSYARMLAPHFKKRLGATVVVVNKPGGGGLNALNSMVGKDSDGLSMMLLNTEGALLAQLVDRPGLRFDLSKLGFLGRVSYENRVLLASAKSPFSKIDGFLKAKEPIHFGATGRVDSMGDAASIFCDALGIPCRLILGYKGSSEVTLAVIQNEVNAQVTSESQTAKRVRAGDVAAVAVLAPNKAPLLPGVPSIFDLVKLSPKQAKWIRFRATISDIGRTMIVPPGVPKERAAVLEKVVHDTLTDKQLQAEAERVDRPISYAPPEEIRKGIKQIFTDLSPKERQEIKDLLLSRY